MSLDNNNSIDADENEERIFNEINRKIKLFKLTETSLTAPKEMRIQRLLEDFEKQFDIKNSIVANEDGLIIAQGFKERYLNPHILGGMGIKLFDSAKVVIDEVLAKYHFKTDLVKFFKDLPKRNVKLKNVIIETEMDDFDNPSAGMKDVYILVSPIESIGFIFLILENKEHMALLKMNLPDLKSKIRCILF